MPSGSNIRPDSVGLFPRAQWPSTGFVTVNQILGKTGGPIPVSASRWWAGVRAGEFPKPVRLGGRTVWCVQDINDLIARVGGAPAHNSSKPAWK